MNIKHISILCILLTLILAGACVSELPTEEPQSPGPTQEADSATDPAQPAQPVATATETPPPGPTATREPSPTPEPLEVRFAVIGDFGQQGSFEQSVADLVKSWEPELIITTGDNNYPDGEAETIDANIGQYYHEFIAPYQGEYGPGAEQNRFFPTLGNHDWNTPDLSPHLDYFELPGNERYYDFIWGPVHFFALSSDSREPDGVGRSSAQAEWLQTAMQASEMHWQIVYMHQPPYSSSRHGSTDWMQWPFKEWGADAVISGHDHVYERLIVDDLVYFTNGLGGHPARYTFPIAIPGSEVRYRSDFGAMLVDATETSISFKFINVTGETIDSYQLTQAPRPTPTPSPTPVFVTEFPPAESYTWEPVADGFERALLAVSANDGTGRMFVAEQSGQIWIIQDGTRLPEPFLDLRDRVFDEGYELGLLGLVFDPDFARNRTFFVKYTDSTRKTITSRFRLSEDDPNKGDPDSENVLLRIQHPFGNHNGGHLAFGPDGYLYVSVGDGGSAGDPNGNGQNTSTLLGTLLRLDVHSGDTYSVPADNPFVDGGGLPEIWHYGLRNPWRFSFDRASGDLYIADVGQSFWEEINFIPAGSPGGDNFGWNYLEGTHRFQGSPPEGSAFVGPVVEYNHEEGGCSVTGGYVYRGTEFPEWQGIYLYGDFCSGFIWGMLRDSSGAWQSKLLFDTNFLVSSFGEDEAGELYAVDWRGAVYRLARP